MDEGPVTELDVAECLRLRVGHVEAGTHEGAVATHRLDAIVREELEHVLPGEEGRRRRSPAVAL
jgi:hypothetical protein